ncbi:MAG: hypothetical protein CL787_03160 [Chloroflexi bacterium]|nr:hypothetical protein [Chloroflexota bacterium]
MEVRRLSRKGNDMIMHNKQLSINRYLWIILAIIFIGSCAPNNPLSEYLKLVDELEESYTSELGVIAKNYPTVFDEKLSQSASRDSLLLSFEGYWSEAIPVTEKAIMNHRKLSPPESAITYHNSMQRFLEDSKTIYSDGLYALKHDLTQMLDVMARVNAMEYERSRLVDLRHSLWDQATK